MTRRVMALLSIPFLSLFFGVVILGWGDIESFFAHPARAGFVLVTVVLFVVSLPSGMNASAGQREDRRNRWIFIPLAMVVIAFTYGAPTADRRDLLTLDGDTVRYLGVRALRGWRRSSRLEHVRSRTTIQRPRGHTTRS